MDCSKMSGGRSGLRHPTPSSAIRLRESPGPRLSVNGAVAIGMAKGGHSMHRIRDDVRLALRGFRRTPGFVVAAVSLLAIGIGTASAIFSVAITILVRDLPVRDQ